MLLLMLVDDVTRVVYFVSTACAYFLCYVISSLFFMWLLMRHRTRLCEELNDDDVRVDVDAEEQISMKIVAAVLFIVIVFSKL